MTGPKEIMSKIKIHHFYFLTLLKNDTQTIKELKESATNPNFLHYSNDMIRTLLIQLCTLELISQKRIEGGRRKYRYRITDEGENVLNQVKTILDGI